MRPSTAGSTLRALARWGLTLGLGSAAASAAAQGPRPSEPSPKKPPGLLRAGPFWLNPRLTIGTLGLDTNVFYTPDERRTDLRGSGGPGLEVILPLGGDLALKGDGYLDYLYYVRTPSLRRLSGGGKGRLEWAGERVLAGAEHAYISTFSRPSFEVDRRVEQHETRSRAELRVKAGHRFAFALEGLLSRNEVEDGATFFGADLKRTLTRKTTRGFVELGYRVTPKTSLLAEGDHQLDRFRLDPRRDADSNRLGGGFRLDSETRLSGRAVAGVRSFRPLDPRGQDLRRPYALVDLVYHFGPRTRLGGAYRRDLNYSAFDTAGGSPTLIQEVGTVRLEKGLGQRFDVRLHGDVTRLQGDGAITVVPRPGGAVTAVRDDTVYEAGGELGYTFRSRLRFGAGAAYTERRSRFADLGIRGLLLGGTITFTP
ncbi:MAG TPA: outer membrane beta-barrel protein [Vicinamibacteria bacterium]